MSRAIIATPVSTEVLAAVAEGWAAYNAATSARGPADGNEVFVEDELDKQLIDIVIRAFIRQGKPFSANAIRPHVTGVRKCLISRRLIVAQNEGLIRYAGVTPSTLRSTKSARVNVYVPIRGALEAAS